MYWPKFLTYGNWCAPGWSGGKWVDNPEEVDWSVPPIDEMDVAGYFHDWTYQHGGIIWEADLRFVLALRKVNPKGRYANSFRWVAIVGFTVKGFYGFVFCPELRGKGAGDGFEPMG